MAIYKLGEIGIFKGGISSLDKSKYDSGILFVNYMDVFKNSYIDQYAKLRKYDASKNDIKKYSLSYGDALFTASSETPNEIAISSIYLSNKNAIFNGFCKRFKYNHLILMPKYASYYFRSKNFRKEAIKYSTGYTRFNISQKNLEEIQIRIPCLKIQKQIIDIIEPIENLIFNMKKIKVHLWNLIKKIEIKKTKQINIFSSIKTGNLNVNASSKNGKYPFFTCGKKILKTNSKSFKGRYILLSGNGELYSWWIDGEFDLYQRVYALKEKNNFFTTYYSLIKGIDKLRRRANGAVIKFIKINDIKSISLYESSHEKILETIFIAINKCEEIESKAYKILDFVVQILIK